MVNEEVSSRLTRDGYERVTYRTEIHYFVAGSLCGGEAWTARCWMNLLLLHTTQSIDYVRLSAAILIHLRRPAMTKRWGVGACRVGGRPPLVSLAAPLTGV